MPSIINMAAFTAKFAQLELNTSDTKAFLAKGVKDYVVDGIVVPTGFRLVEAKAPAMYDGFPMIRIRLVDYRIEGIPIIVYAVNLMIRNDLCIDNRHCTQVLVWRSPQPKYKKVLNDFATIMFDHFCESYIVIASDTSQTNDGRRFWESRILEAFDYSRFVYFADHNELGDNLIPRLNHIPNTTEFYEKWFDHGWGEGEEYKDRLFLISTSDLIA